MDLSSIQFHFNVLVVEASEDPLAKFTDDSRINLRSKFSLSPSSSKDETVTHEVVKGGNHGGFAEYPPTLFDGNRKIDLAVQHEIVSEITVNFLHSRKFS